MQSAIPLPSSVPLCADGHKPQFVTTQGAPTGHLLGAPCPPLFHIECHACQLATVPTPNRALAELRWTREDTAVLRIPISHLKRYRAEVLADLHPPAAAYSLLTGHVRSPINDRRHGHGRTTFAG